jgi:hypothetical protein
MSNTEQGRRHSASDYALGSGEPLAKIQATHTDNHNGYTMTNYNPYKTDTITPYVDSPLPEYSAGRSVACHNDKCSAYGKTTFRIVNIKRFVDHETQYWACARCGSQHIIETETT